MVYIHIFKKPNARKWARDDTSILLKSIGSISQKCGYGLVHQNSGVDPSPYVKLPERCSQIVHTVAKGMPSHHYHIMSQAV